MSHVERHKIIEALDDVRDIAGDSSPEELLNRLDRLEILILEEQAQHDIQESKLAHTRSIKSDFDDEGDESFQRLSSMLEQSILFGRDALNLASSSRSETESVASPLQSEGLWSEATEEDKPEPPAYEEPRNLLDDGITMLENMIDQITSAQDTATNRRFMWGSIVLVLAIFLALIQDWFRSITCHCVCPAN